MRAKDIDKGIEDSRVDAPFIVWTNVSGTRVRVVVDYGFNYSRSSYGRRVRRYQVTRVDNGKRLPKGRTAASLHCTDGRSGEWPSMTEKQDRPAPAADSDEVWAVKLAALLAQEQGMPAGNLWEPSVSGSIHDGLKLGRSRDQVEREWRFQLGMVLAPTAA